MSFWSVNSNFCSVATFVEIGVLKIQKNVKIQAKNQILYVRWQKWQGNVFNNLLGAKRVLLKYTLN